MGSRLTLADVATEQRSHTNSLSTHGADIKELKASLLRALLRIDALQSASGLTLDGSGNLVISSADVYANNFDGDALILDEYLEMSGSSAAAVSPAGTGRIRYNESTHVFEQSLNGAAWSTFGGSSLPVGGVGSTWYEGAASAITRLAAGTEGQVLTAHGAAAPTWTTLSTLPSSDEKTDLGQLAGAPQGTVWYASAAGRVTRLAPGTAGHFLQTGGAAANPAWAAQAAGGGTLDYGYDFGGAGAGRALTIDAGALQLTGNAANNNNTLEVTKSPAGAQSGNAVDVAMNANASGAGVKVTHDGLATETTHGLGVWLLNSTPAANGAQQVSPDLKLTGHAWKSDATAASQQHDWVFRVFPTQGTATTTSAISIRHRIDAAAFATIAQITSSGQYLSGGLGTAALPGHGTTSAPGLGVFFPTSSTVAIAISSAESVRFAAAAMTGPDGSSTSPYYSFTGATGLGMYRSTNQLGLRGIGGIDLNVNGTVIAVVGSTAFYPATTAATSLGQSGLRWTVIYGQSADLSQAVGAGTTASPALKVTGAAHTTQTAGAEIVDIDFALNRTVQHATGAVATQRAVIYRAPTYSFVASSTITDAVTVEITGAPAAGTNAIITNAWALRVAAGNTRLAGVLSVGGNGTFGGQVTAAAGGDAGSPAFTVSAGGSGSCGVSAGNTGGGGTGSELWLIVGGSEQVYVRNSLPFVALNGYAFSLSTSTTKLYSDASNSIAIDVSGSEYFRIRADGARFSRSVRTVPVVLTDAATVTPDLALSNQFTHTATASRTYANPSNIVAGMQWQVDFTQNGTGGWSITWGSSYVGPNGAAASTVQPETGANRVTVLTFKAITTTKIAVIKSDWY